MEPHYFAFSTNWQGGKRVCRDCGRTYDAGKHIESNVLKPYTNYVCPSGGGYGHSSTWSGARDVPELRSERDKFCLCGLELIEEDKERWLLSWEMIGPFSDDWRPVENMQSKHAALLQKAGLEELIARGEPIRNVRLMQMVEASR